MGTSRAKIKLNWTFPLLLISSSHIGNDYIFFQWFTGLLICLAFVTPTILRETSFLITLLFIYLTGYVFYEIFASFSAYAGLDLRSRIPLFLAASVNYVCVTALCAGMMSLSSLGLILICRALPLCALTNALYVIGNWACGVKFTNSMGFSGFLDYSGMNGVLIAITMIPSVVKLTKDHKDKFSWAVVICSLGAIYLSRGSIPYGVLFCGGSAILFHQRAKLSWWLLPILLIPVILSFVAEGSQLFDSGQRLHAYKIFMSHWWKTGHIFTGLGPSSFQILSRDIQKQAGFMVQGDQLWVWLWMHSDWLQTIFEFGLIGFTLIVSITLQTLYKLSRLHDPTTFAIAVALASSAVFDYPARLFPTAILIAWVVIYAHRRLDAEDFDEYASGNH